MPHCGLGETPAGVGLSAAWLSFVGVGARFRPLRCKAHRRCERSGGVGRAAILRAASSIAECHRPIGRGVPASVSVLILVLASCGTSAADRREAIDSFQVPEGWVEITDPLYSGESREGLCIGPFDCEVSLVVQWRVPEKPSPPFLQRAAETAGWRQIEFVRPCSDDISSCWLRAESDGVKVSLSYRSESGPSPWIVRLKAE